MRRRRVRPNGTTHDAASTQPLRRRCVRTRLIERRIMSQPNVPVIAHFINGALAPSASERHSDVFNPALGRVSARVALASRAEVGAAVAAAKAAYPAWSETAPLKRARIM